jgi:hypothetical protein
VVAREVGALGVECSDLQTHLDGFVGGTVGTNSGLCEGARVCLAACGSCCGFMNGSLGA